MARLADTGEAHRDETGQRRRFEESAAGGLNGFQNTQALVDRQTPDDSCDWIPRAAVVVDGLADGNESGQCVADDRQTEEAEAGLGEAGQFEGERGNLAPVDEAGEGAGHEDGAGESAIFAVAG